MQARSIPAIANASIRPLLGPARGVLAACVFLAGPLGVSRSLVQDGSNTPERPRAPHTTTPALPERAGTPAQPPPEPGATPAAPTADLLETMRSRGELSRSALLFAKSGMAERLKTGGPFTIFVPSDAAFQTLNKQSQDTLLGPEQTQRLDRVLAFHVIEGTVSAADLKTMTTSKPTLHGGTFTIDASEPDAVRVGVIPQEMATVRATDIKASNGLIHVIDRLMIPPDLDGAPGGAVPPKGVAPETPRAPGTAR